VNKKLIAGILIALILIVGGSLAYKKFGSNSEIQNQQPATLNSDEGSSSPVSLKSLLATGSSQTCTFQNSGDNASTGTMYISEGKVRGDFNSMVENKPLVSHILIDNNTSYLWTDGQPTGFKTSFDVNSAADSLGTGSPDSITESFDPDANLNYNCTAWTQDSSKFTLPAGVEFTDLNAQLSSQCAVCDSLTGDAKTQCQLALKCN
jgi:hypothetical protein